MNVERRVIKYLEDHGFNYRFVSVDDLVFSPFTRFKCMQCANYHSTYACPPFTPIWKNTKKILQSYDKLLLVWRYIDLQKYVENLVKKHGMEYSPRVVLYVQSTADKIQKSFDRYIIECGKMLEGAGYDVLYLLSGGGCRRCKKIGCSLWHNKSIKVLKDKVIVSSSPKPCRYGRPLYSMEGVGIAVYDTLIKLGIEFEPVPRTKTISVMLLCWKTEKKKLIGIERWLYG